MTVPSLTTSWLHRIGLALQRLAVKTLAELRAFNTARANRNAIKYGQANLDVSDELDVTNDRARWEADRRKDIYLSATHGIARRVRESTALSHVLDGLNLASNALLIGVLVTLIRDLSPNAFNVLLGCLALAGVLTGVTLVSAYLLASAGDCCNGPLAGYTVFAGRSTSPSTSQESILNPAILPLGSLLTGRT